jgi:hypothetical protein
VPVAVAVAALVRLVAPGDVMDGDAASTHEVIERRQVAAHHRRL